MLINYELNCFQIKKIYLVSNIQILTWFFINKHSSNFFNLYPEPIGFKSPTLSSDFEGTRLRKSSKNAIVLLCQSQGYPVPEFR